MKYLENFESLDDRKKQKLIFLSIFVFSFLIYSGSLFNGFVWDSVITFRDPRIQDASLVKKFFYGTYLHQTEDKGLSYYRPIVGVIHFIFHSFIGAKPLAWKILNLVLNSVLCCLVYLSIQKVSRHLAFYSAILYSCIPIRSEIVYWDYSDSYLYVGVFLLASFIFYAEERCYYSLLFFCLAIFSHEIAIVFPLVLASYSYYKRRAIKSYLSWLTLFFLIAAVYLYIRISVFGAIPTPRVGIQEFFNGSAYVIFKYLKIFFSPEGKATAYVYQKGMFSGMSPGILIGYVVAFLLVALSVCWARSKPSRFFWATWALIFILPSFNIGEVGDYYLAEKALHLSAIGMIVIFLDLFNDTNLRTRNAVIAFFFIWYSGWTIARAPVWKSTETYLQEAINFEKNFALGYLGLGEFYMERGDLDEALHCMKKAQEIKPKSGIISKGISKVLNNKGLYYYSKGDFLKAEESFRAAVANYPFLSYPYDNLGIVLARQNRNDEAIVYFKKALEYDGNNIKAALHLADVLMLQGKFEECIVYLKQYKKQFGFQNSEIDAKLIQAARFAQSGF